MMAAVSRARLRGLVYSAAAPKRRSAGDGVRLVEPGGIERDIRPPLDPAGGIAGGAAVAHQHQARRFFRIDVEEFVHLGRLEGVTDQAIEPRRTRRDAESFIW